MEVISFQHFAIARQGQLPHELANAFREQLMVEALLERQRFVLEIAQQFAIAVVLARQLSTPVGGGELACRAIEIASKIARVIQSFSTNLLDRLQERALQQVLGRITSDTPVEEYLQQRPPISHVKLILETLSLADGCYQG